MQKSIRHLACAGLVTMIMLLAACGANGAGRGDVNDSRVRTSKGLFSETYDSLGSFTQTGITPQRVETLTPRNGGITINPAEGSEMYRLEFGASNNRAIGFTRGTAVSIDLTPFANGALVFSVNYAVSANMAMIDSLMIKMESDDGMGGRVSAAVNILDTAVIDPTPMPDADGWREFRIPLSVFKTINVGLDLAQISTYFEFSEPIQGMTRQAGTVLLDNIYFDPAAP